MIDRDQRNWFLSQILFENETSLVAVCFSFYGTLSLIFNSYYFCFSI